MVFQVLTLHSIESRAVLIVTPVNEGSGETVTARYLARSLVRQEHESSFLPHHSPLLADEFSQSLIKLGLNGPGNVSIWGSALERCLNVIVFADYPLMFGRRA